MFKYLCIIILSLGCMFSLQASQRSAKSSKMYIDEEDFSAKGDAFHIHLGHNVWLVTNTVHRDETGLYTYESHLSRSMKDPNLSYEKKWKCPYCYHYWPIGTACQNAECPSKYKIL